MIQRFLEVVTWISVIDFKSLDDAGKANIVAAISQAAAALLAMIALLVSLWIFARQQNISRWQLRVAREAEIIAWSRQCMGTLSEIEEKVRLNSGAPHSLVASDVAVYRGRLSALIDEGRLYFPNKDNIFAGQNRPTAYQGLRQRVLDPLVEVYEQMPKLVAPDGGDVDSHALGLRTLRRSFVSLVQEAINPRRFNRIKA